MGKAASRCAGPQLAGASRGAWRPAGQIASDGGNVGAALGQPNGLILEFLGTCSAGSSLHAHPSLRSSGLLGVSTKASEGHTSFGCTAIATGQGQKNVGSGRARVNYSAKRDRHFGRIVRSLPPPSPSPLLRPELRAPKYEQLHSDAYLGTFCRVVYDNMNAS